MKVISYTFNIGYGFVLQAFALQKFLIFAGFSAEHLKLFMPSNNYVSEQKKNIFPIFIWKPIAILRKMKYILQNLFYYRKFFYKVNLKFTNNFAIDKDNCFIVGSDQVWNPNFIKNMERIYFLDFTDSAKKISYAASLGMREWPKEFEQMVLPWLKKFHAISVREENSAEYLRNLGLNAVCVCDPTILHEGDFYRREFDLRSLGDKGKFVFNYFFRGAIPQIDEIENITVNFKNKKTMVSVNKWLSLIDNSIFVLTDSFHCVVFCLLFHKPFAVFQNNGELKGMNSRFSTILGKMNLEYRLLQGTEPEGQILDIINREIDWRRIDEILEEWRNYSKKWLMEAIR
jgi:hypothetical protein